MRTPLLRHFAGGAAGVLLAATAAAAPAGGIAGAVLGGTCAVAGNGVFGRWTLKAVLHDGDNLLDAPVTFRTEQHLSNLLVVFTDRRSGLSLRIADENGQPAIGYVVVVYPVEKARRRESVRIIAAGPADDEMMAARPDPSLTGGSAAVPAGPRPPRPRVIDGLRPGDYYAVAVDDMEPDDPNDPAVLGKLRSSATRVTVTEGSIVQVTLRRVKLADVLAR